MLRQTESDFKKQGVELIDALNKCSENIFWPSPPDSPTFQEILNKYTEYYKNLDLERQKQISVIFWEKIKALGTPLIENILGDEENNRLVFVVQGNPSDKFQLVSSICGSNMMKKMQFKEGTDIWYIEIDKVPNNARISYQFLNNQQFLTDPLNPYQIPGFHYNPPQNMYDMPQARKQPFLHRETLSAIDTAIRSTNRLLEREINFENSNILKNKRPYMNNSRLSLNPGEDEFRKITHQGPTRQYWIHFPPDYNPNRQPPYKVLLHLDGHEALNCMQAHAVMENAIKDKAIEPTISIFLDVGNRNFEYGPGSDGENFADFVAKEFLPSLQNEFIAMSRDSKDVTIAGYSMGGHAATHIATRHPNVFGNVISQSGSFWMGSGSIDTETKEFQPENEQLKKSLERRVFPDSDKAKDMCFYLTVGSLEAMGGKLFLNEKGEIRVGGAVTHNAANENLATYLQGNGLSVHYLEYSGDHNFAEWQGGLVEGLRETQLLRLKKSLENTSHNKSETPTAMNISQRSSRAFLYGQQLDNQSSFPLASQNNMSSTTRMDTHTNNEPDQKESASSTHESLSPFRKPSTRLTRR